MACCAALRALTSIAAAAALTATGLGCAGHTGDEPTEGAAAGSGLAAAGAPKVTLRNPIDAQNQLRLPWGTRSHWLQPWRGYLDTVPATRLRDAAGINMNVANPVVVDVVARLLHDAGFRRARLEVGWNQIDYDHPTRLAPRPAADLRARLLALRRHGLRPLLVLNANDGAPVPARPFDATLREPAAANAREVLLTPNDARRVVPGRTGLQAPESRRAVNAMITAIQPDGRATLSRPLGTAAPGGRIKAQTLLYAPFQTPKLPDGRPNPAFERTMGGWLDYIGAITTAAKRALGDTRFDVEIWNELSFGSTFINPAANYADTNPRESGAPRREILFRSVAYLRDPAHGVADIGIGNGFANQMPWPNGEESPPGLTAIDKHPYQGLQRFPEDAPIDGNRPLDANGRPNFERVIDPKCNCPQFKERFTPRYDAFLPEWWLTGVQTETLIRDLSPMTTKVGAANHGRATHPPGSPAPTMWITEVNIGPGSVVERDGARFSPQDIDRMQAKATLRYLASYVNKGVTAIHFYAVDAGALSLVSPRFLQRVKRAVRARRATRSSAVRYPGLRAGGTTMRAVGRLMGSLRGARPLTRVRSLRLEAIGDFQGHVQFRGDGSPGRPSLYNRDVLAVFPFQVDEHRFVIPTYVMTRSLAKVQQPKRPASDPARLDLPPERYRLTIANLPSCNLRIGATDPLDGSAVPVRRVGCRDGRLEVEMLVTDAPRLLTIDAR